MFEGRLFYLVYMDVVALVSGCFRRNKKVGRLRLIRVAASAI